MIIQSDTFGKNTFIKCYNSYVMIIASRYMYLGFYQNYVKDIDT